VTGPLNIPGIIDDSEAGIFATIPPRPVFPAPVAPTTVDNPAAFNLVRQPLSPVACANLPDRHFLFDSSAPAPEPGRPFELLQAAFKAFAAKLLEFPLSPMSIFGHADPVGKDLYNKFLSERRARAIFAILVRDVAIWEKLFSNQEGSVGDKWGLRTLQRMLDHLGFEPGNFDGRQDNQTRSALQDVKLGLQPQPDRQPVSAPVGQNDAPTRKILFTRYMETVCPNPEGTTLFPLPAERFLGDFKSHRGVLQGCSSFNPLLLLSRDETNALKGSGDVGEAVRNAAHEPDRRVIAYLFPAGTIIDPKRWPCPTAAESDVRVTGCRKRFWSNGEQRRATHFNAHRREFGKSVPDNKALLTPENAELARAMAREETTFACRFYHGIALHSPCERDLKLWVVRLKVDVPTIGRFVPPFTRDNTRAPERNRQIPMANVRFAASIGSIPGSPIVRGKTSRDGIIILPFFDAEARMTIALDAWGPRIGPDDPAIQTDPPATPPDDTLPRTNPWPGEERFLKMPVIGTLVHLRRSPADDDDAPDPSATERTLGLRQRLFDLGYGGGDPAAWTQNEETSAVRHFQENHPPLRITSTADADTEAVLIAATGEFSRSAVAPAPAPPAPAPPVRG
jgi:hypothetical protein